MSWRSDALSVFDDIGRFPPRPDGLPKMSRALWDVSEKSYYHLQLSVFRADAQGVISALWLWAGALDLFVDTSIKYPKEQRDIQTYETMQEILKKALRIMDIFEIEANLYVKGGNHEKCESIFPLLDVEWPIS